MPHVKLQKLSSTTAWLILDLPDVTCAGPTTLGPNVLQTNAKLTARAQTYRHALVGERLGGGAGGIKVTDTDRADAVAAYVEEVAPLTEAGTFYTSAGWGLTDDELAGVHAHDPRNPAAWGDRDELVAASAVGVIQAAVGDLAGATISIAALGPTTAAVARALVSAGATVVAVGRRGGRGVIDPAGLSADRLGALADGTAQDGDDETTVADVRAIECDVHVPATGLRAVTHDDETGIGARHLVGVSELVVTPKAVAQLRRRDVEVWPDWLASIGPTVAAGSDHDTSSGDLSDRAQQVAHEAATAAAEHPEGPYVGACVAAEEHLATWCDEVPFGRPLP